MAETNNGLLLKLTSPEPLSPSCRQALAQLQGPRMANGWIRLLEGEPWADVVRGVWRAGMPVGATLTVFCEHACESADQPYSRLWDRTDDLAGALADWRAGRAGWPPLQPGEIVRLA